MLGALKQSAEAHHRVSADSYPSKQCLTIKLADVISDVIHQVVIIASEFLLNVTPTLSYEEFKFLSISYP